MKGIVFTEFLDFVAAKWGEDLVDDLVEMCDLPSAGAYTAVGTYDHREMMQLCHALGEKTREPGDRLLRQFGRHLGHRFAHRFPAFFEAKPTLFSFLDSVDGHIHVEVRKLYQDTELPEFRARVVDADQMVMEYRSSRHLQSLAVGLILGAADYYRETVAIGASTERDDAGEYVAFTIGRVA